MNKWNRRDLLKGGIASFGAGMLLPNLATANTDISEPLTSNVSSLFTNITSNGIRDRLLLDFGWRFTLGHATDPAQDFNFNHGKVFARAGMFATPALPGFDDSQWHAVDLPHDWVVELLFENTDNLNDFGYKPLGRTNPETSIGWYRRAFEIPASDLGRRISLEFDGVFRDSVVILNGFYIGRHLSGYSPFRFDVTDFINYGGKNALAVRTDATAHEGWFYEGAGIYRHAWLTKTNPVHVAQWGSFVTSEVRSGAATLEIATEVDNESNNETPFRVVSNILDPNGKVIATSHSSATTVPAWNRTEVRQRVEVVQPALWSIEEPTLYRLVTTLEVGGLAVDQYETSFGIRTIRFDADRGFFLNEKRVKIKGTCNHQDHAGVGSALPDRLQYFRIEKLKDMGCNAYRTSHNPPTPELLDACDRLGMLVMDETRLMSSCPDALNDLETMVRRDRNHPSIFCWSICNEENEQGTERGARIGSTMKRLIRGLDPTRPVTAAMNHEWGGGLSGVIDLQGFNYRNGWIDEFHARFPTMPTVGAEVASTLCTRGIYSDETAKGYVNAYDRRTPPWGATAEGWWKMYEERAFLSGGFVWTGFDYRGEPNPYKWPCISSHFGILDTCGFPKDNFYYYQSWWTEKPVLHLFPHWNWSGKEGKDIEVWCHTNVERVELFLNSRSLGTQEVARNSHVMWKVPYESGTIEARGYRNGQPALVARRETTGVPAKIVLRADRERILADGEDVSIVEAQVVDTQGRVVPTASDMIEFHLSGSARLIGVGNGDPSCHEPDKAMRRSAFNGLCMAIVQSTKQPGEVRIEASSPGLQSSVAVIVCTPTTLRPSVPSARQS
jgi:beta-galactosidase